MRVIAMLAALCPVPVAAAADALRAADPEAIRAHVSFLADDLLEGRATGSRGYDIAAHYVAAQMQLMGLKPAGIGGAWMQPVPMVESTRIVPAAKVAILRGTEQIDLLPAVDFIPSPSHLAGEVSVTAPLAFVGFGVSAPEVGYDDFDGVELSGKVAVVLSGVPATIPAERRVYYAKEKTQQIADRGAVGIVHVTTPAEAARTPWETTVAKARVPSLRLLDENDQPLESQPGLEAGITLSANASSRLLADAPKPLGQIWADADAGIPQSFDLRASISIATRSALHGVDSVNVVGLLEGSSPQLRHEYVVLMAHLDHIGRGTAVNGDAIYNGALDNASGIAVMLEAARALATMKQRPKRSILFLAVTAEERGLLGSRHFALRPTVPRGSIVAVVNLDMPVALYPAAGYTVIGGEHSSLGDVARRALEAEGLKALPNQAPERGLFAFTDQYSFVREGIPALYLHDGPVSADPAIDAQQVFNDFLGRHYHQPSDQMDLPIDWTSLARLARVHARLCREIADAEEQPRWVPGDFYGERFGKR